MKGREKLVQVFDNNALAYDKYRPTYPKELVEDLISLSQINLDDQILEIGCGTGQITMDFVKRGYQVTAVEKGKHLAEIATNKIARFGTGQVIQASFEEWIPSHKFKFIVSAQAFHWIDKQVGINKVLRLLNDDGALGLVWNVDKSQNTAFWQQTSGVYEKYLPMRAGSKNMEDTIEEHINYISSQNEFGELAIKAYPWQKGYSAEEYLGLLTTFSNHMTLDATRRECFFNELMPIIEQNNNKVLKHYKAVLLFCRKQTS